MGTLETSNFHKRSHQVVENTGEVSGIGQNNPNFGQERSRIGQRGPDWEKGETRKVAHDGRQRREVRFALERPMTGRYFIQHSADPGLARGADPACGIGATFKMGHYYYLLPTPTRVI